MSTLRNLLYQPAQKNQCSQKFDCTSWNPQGCTFTMMNWCQNTPDNSYNSNCMNSWCVPADTRCCVTFELIGGGGSGAGGCCCQQGAPGGSGSYAVKTLLIQGGTDRLNSICTLAGGTGPGAWCCSNGSSATQPSPYGCQQYNQRPDIAQQAVTLCSAGGYTTPGFTMPGCCYCLTVAYPAGCSIDCRGCQGCTTWVQGGGLCNLCAEGGLSGASCCFTFWGNYSTYASQCCHYGAIYMDGHNEMSCTCYFGADCGAPGRAGYLWSLCGCGSSCYWKQFVPFPGGLVNTGGGFMSMRTQGDACNQEWSRCTTSIGWPIDHNGSGYLPGQGGMTVTSCGNPCCYGFPGGAGFIRITYR